MSSATAISIHPALDRLLRYLRGRPEIRSVILFGSRARGDADDRSDIDLAIEAPSLTRRQWLEIAEKVDEAETLLSIDLIRLEEASDSFRKRIESEGIPLYERLQSQTEP